MISKLIYLVYGIRPDIAFTVGQLSKHNADPKKGHLQAVKRVVRYLKGIIQMELVFGREIKGHLPRNLPLYGFIGYANNNFVGDSRDCKSVMGYYFFLNGVIVL